MTYIKLGGVRAFPGVQPTNEQALKVLEEAAEVVEVFKQYDRVCTDVIHPKEAAPFMRAGFKDSLMDEIADTIQACCNLASALGVDDLAPYLARCEERNRERGRYGD